jgi:hypothetical protein
MGSLTPSSELLRALLPDDDDHSMLHQVYYHEFLNLMNDQVRAEVSGVLFQPKPKSSNSSKKNKGGSGGGDKNSLTQQALQKISQEKKAKDIESAKSKHKKENDDDEDEEEDDHLKSTSKSSSSSSNKVKATAAKTTAAVIRIEGEDGEEDEDPDGDEHEAWEDDHWIPPLVQEEYINSQWGSSARQIHIRIVSAAHLPAVSSSSSSSLTSAAMAAATTGGGSSAMGGISGGISGSGSSDYGERAYVECETYGAPCDKKYFKTSEVGNDGVKFVFDEVFTQ